MPIPILAIANAVSAAIALLLFIRLRKSYHRGGYTNTLIGHFSSFFLFLTIFFLLSFPALVWDKGEGVVVAYQLLLSYLFLSFATGSFLRIPVSVWFGYFSGKGVAWAVYIVGIAAFLLGLQNISPAGWFSVTSGALEIDYFIFTQPVAVRVLSGGVPLLIACVGSVFFICEGLRATSVYVRARSLLMGFGMLLLMGAALANFFISYVVFAFTVNLLASLLALIGLAVMAIGVYVGIPEEGVV